MINQKDNQIEELGKFYEKYPDLFYEAVFNMKFTWTQKAMLRFKMRFLIWWSKLIGLYDKSWRERHLPISNEEEK